MDDGKSTLIGRLLHDSKAVYEDQLASVKKSRVNRSSGPIDFSLLTDGLRAEREQGITIDVAYRYFATARRKFIIADTPGHEQYTRNMATGASTADLAVILIDATKGILAQTRRHTYIAALLGIKNVLAAVNKMDLVDYREDVFVKLEQDFLQLAAQLGIGNVQCVPISALAGDNVVDRSARTAWYAGPTLLQHLETVPLPADDATASLRFPVQTVIRPNAGFRGFAGRIARGTIRPGDEVVALPSGRKTRVQAIVSYDGNLEEAFAPMSVTLQLEDEIDLSRGDMLVAAENLPRVSRKFEAMVVWLHGAALEVGRSYLGKHTARQTRIRALKIRHRVNINTLTQEHPTRLEMNDIALVEFEANVPLFFDVYAEDRTTGSFILIDPLSNATVGAGMIQEHPATKGGLETGEPGISSQHLARASQAQVAPLERYERHGHYPGVLLLENRPELAARVERVLFEKGFEVLHLNAAGIGAAGVIDGVRMAEAAGFVAIYSADALAPETKRILVSLTADRLFDAGAADLSSDEELFHQVVAFARGLLLEAPEDDRKRVN